MKAMGWLTALCALVVACGAPPSTLPEEDAGAEAPYDGPATGVIPVFDPDAIDGGDPIIDAGMVTVDTRCCDTTFSISDQEPPDAVGVLEGQHAVFGQGVPLTRADGGWMVAACFPINESAFYWYRFSWDGGFFDGGTIDLEDGGQETNISQIIQTSTRASDTERSFQDANGDRRNYYRELDSCDGHDGGVPP